MGRVPTQVLVERLSANDLANHKFQAIEPFFGGVIKLDTIAIFALSEERAPRDK